MVRQIVEDKDSSKLAQIIGGTFSERRNCIWKDGENHDNTKTQ